MAQLNDIVSSNLALVVGGLVCVCVALAVLLAVLFDRVLTLRRRLDALTRGVEGKDLEKVMAKHLESVFRVAVDLAEASERITDLENSAIGHFSRMGLIRFNPFSDTGGNQSFALALLDGRGNGFVVSSLHSRTGTRMYSKAVAAGRADTALSDEETQAIEIAMGRKRRRTGPAVVRPANATRPATEAHAGLPRPPEADAPGS